MGVEGPWTRATLDWSPRRSQTAISTVSRRQDTDDFSHSGQRRGRMNQAFVSRPTTLADYLGILGRRKWIILIPLVLAPVLAVIVSSKQQPVYEASAEVYLKRADIAAAVSGVTDPTLQVDPIRFLRTQADVARDPILAQRAVARAGVRGVTPRGLLESSQVTPRRDADLLDVSVTNTEARNAVVLANAYAREFSDYRTEVDTARINAALENVRAKVASLRGQGVSIDSPAYITLLQKQTDLETVGKLLANNTQVLRPAEGAAKIKPRTRRSGIVGVLLGAILGLGLAFVAEALERRVRSEQEIDETLGIPLLGRLPRPSRRLRKANQLVMLANPRSIEAETVRKLRTNVEFANLERNARTIMVTSSVQREGKSTTIANLAVALARAGRRVTLVDLDLRRPYLDRFFRAKSVPGITDVLGGRFELSDAIRSVLVPTAHTRRPDAASFELHAASTSSNGRGQAQGVLRVVPAGTIPPDAGELIGTEALGSVLNVLAEQSDYLLIDSPPLLVVGDAMTLSAKVDAMIIITRLRIVHHGMLRELARLLKACPAEKLGYVIAGAELGDGYGYGYAYGYGYPAARAERDEQQRIS